MGSPNGDVDQSWARISAPVWPPPLRNLSGEALFVLSVMRQAEELLGRKIVLEYKWTAWSIPRSVKGIAALGI